MLDLDYRATWDSPPNRWFTARPHPEFCWGADSDYPGCVYTNVVAITGPGTVFDDPPPPIPSRTIPADTIVAIEIADSGIYWAEPGDLHINDVSETLVDGLDGDGVHVLFFDENVWFLSNDVPLEDLKKFFTIEGAKQNDREQVLGPYAVR